MTQEDKELLLKDLCARLPYGVRYKHLAWDDEHGENYIAVQIYSINLSGYVSNYYDDVSDYIDNVRPYLFPLSSISNRTLEMFDEWSDSKTSHVIMEFYNSHHIDYRGLIEKGLAIDATGLNIY